MRAAVYDRRVCYRCYENIVLHHTSTSATIIYSYAISTITKSRNIQGQICSQYASIIRVSYFCPAVLRIRTSEKHTGIQGIGIRVGQVHLVAQPVFGQTDEPATSGLKRHTAVVATIGTVALER